MDDDLADLAVSEKQTVSDRELIRRQDQVAELKMERDQLASRLTQLRTRLVPAGSREAVSAERTELFGTSLPTQGGGRVIGRETEHTQSMDNAQLHDYSHDIIQEQDQHLETLLQSLRRQREVGEAIGDELDTQQELLTRLDEGVDRT